MGKKLQQAAEKVETKLYDLPEASELVKQVATAKFDETVELTIRLGVDPKRADQMVRGTVVLPHGLGKSVSVCVITSSEKVKEAEEAGAEFVGGEDLVCQGFDRRRIRDVAHDPGHRAAQFFGRGLQGRLFDVGDHHLHALAEKSLGQGLADAARPAGNYGHPVPEFLHGRLLPSPRRAPGSSNE